jgi:dolichol-phosphate mannosyltransferase
MSTEFLGVKLNLLSSQRAVVTAPQNVVALLSIIVPTFNERENVEEFLRRIKTALVGFAWEIVFVDDDSPDGTVELVRAFAQLDPRVRCVQRIGRRGLSSACVEGILATSAPFFAVMDVDLQHDERIIPQMLQSLHDDNLDIVIGSRYVKGGGVGEWQEKRASMSRFATTLSRLVIKSDLRDPMSGFFIMRRVSFMKSCHRLSNIGFKILLDIFASSPVPLKFLEVPYEFRPRFAGESKLDSVAIWDYGLLLLDKLIGRRIPVRFIMFSIIGAVGLGIHLVVLGMMLGVAHRAFGTSQTVATLVAMTANFFFNNTLTFRDRRLKGLTIVRGLLSFYAVCGLGALANIGVASYVFEQHYSWWMSGISGVIIGAVWNYAATSVFTWRGK